MLPPPTTMQTSSPLSLASFTSSATRSQVSGSMPNCPRPIRTSPESLRRMRLNRGADIGTFGYYGYWGAARTLEEPARGNKRPDAGYPPLLPRLLADLPPLRQDNSGA